MTSSLKRLQGMDLSDIKALSREESIELLTKGSDALRKRYERLEKNYNKGESPFLRGEKTKSITRSQAEKMSNRDIRNKLQKISRRSQSKTSTKRGTEEYKKDFIKATGVNPGSLSSEDWRKIDEQIAKAKAEGYESEDVITSYITGEVDLSDVELRRIERENKEEVDDNPFDFVEITDDDVPFLR